MSDDSSSVPPAPPPIREAPTLPSAVQRVSKVRWGIHLAIMAALPVVAGTAGAARLGDGPALGHTVGGLLRVCAFEMLFFGVAFGLAWLFSRATKDDLLLRWRPGYWVVPLGALYSVGIHMVAGMVMAVAIGIVMVGSGASVASVQKYTEEHRPQVEKLVDLHAMASSPLYFWLNVILVSLVVGGLREELWRSSFLAGLRSLWPRAFGSTNGGIAAAAVAALFFGAGHLPQGLLAAALITVVGFLLGVIMTVHRSVWPSVVAHGLFDAVSLAALPFVMHLLKNAPHAGG